MHQRAIIMGSCNWRLKSSSKHSAISPAANADPVSPTRSVPAEEERWQAATGGPSRRQRCDARVKNLFGIGKNRLRLTRSLYRKAWAMENGRAGCMAALQPVPRTPEGDPKRND